MEKLNKLGLLCVVLALFVSGCGKKKSSTTNESPKKLASADKNIPLKGETDSILEDNDISDFAFVDDEAKDGKGGSAKVASNDVNNVVAEDDYPAEDAANESSFKTVYFNFNKNSIRADQQAVVKEDIAAAKETLKEGKLLVIEGHCCQTGSAAYNLALSQRRANTIKKAMLSEGISAKDIKTIGYGYERPVVWSDAKDRSTLIKELAPNRRAEIVVN
jgi:peptidoglycan-associated lipoprotein